MRTRKFDSEIVWPLSAHKSVAYTVSEWVDGIYSKIFLRNIWLVPKEWQEKVYLENRMMATNDRNDTTRKQVTAIDVNDIQQQKKEAAESAQLT